MPRTRECDFCGTDIEPGTGTMLVLNNGTTRHFCSGKCEKNTDLGRKAREVEWTETGGRQGGPTRTETRDTEEPEEDVESGAVDTDDEPTEGSDVDTDEAEEESTDDAEESNADDESESDDVEAGDDGSDTETDADDESDEEDDEE